MFGEDDSRAEEAQRFRERGIEERRVLVRVNDVDAAFANGVRDLAAHTKVAARLAAETNQIDAFGQKFFPEYAANAEGSFSMCWHRVPFNMGGWAGHIPGWVSPNGGNIPEPLLWVLPFYVGIGFTSHLPANVLTAKVSDVVMENASGKIR